MCRHTHYHGVYSCRTPAGKNGWCWHHDPAPGARAHRDAVYAARMRPYGSMAQLPRRRPLSRRYVMRLTAAEIDALRRLFDGNDLWAVAS